MPAVRLHARSAAACPQCGRDGPHNGFSIASACTECGQDTAPVHWCSVGCKHTWCQGGCAGSPSGLANGDCPAVPQAGPRLFPAHLCQDALSSSPSLSPDLYHPSDPAYLLDDDWWGGAVPPKLGDLSTCWDNFPEHDLLGQRPAGGPELPASKLEPGPIDFASLNAARQRRNVMRRQQQQREEDGADSH